MTNIGRINDPDYLAEVRLLAREILASRGKEELGGSALEAYQSWVRKTSFDINAGSDTSYELLYIMSGLVEEIGEVCKVIKKMSNDKSSIDFILVSDKELEKFRIKLTDEIGDVLWYLTRLTLIANIPMHDILETNVSKLSKRYNLK